MQIQEGEVAQYLSEQLPLELGLKHNRFVVQIMY